MGLMLWERLFRQENGLRTRKIPWKNGPRTNSLPNDGMRKSLYPNQTRQMNGGQKRS